MFICRGYGRYCAVLHTLPQVYRGVLVGEHCLSCITGGVNCSNYYVLANKLCIKRGGNCATFYRLMRASLWFVVWTRMKKGLRFSEGLCIHNGGDEGDRTPDLLTASQALSQLSYAPVTRRYYRGMFCLMQEIFVETFSYGFSWDGAELTDFDFGKISQLTHRPDKTLTV